jgi:micrococcal nuclease
MHRIITGLLLAALLASAAPGSNWDVVTRVIDGDTVILKSVGRARLIGIDAPETVHPRKRVQHFGREASQFTRRHLLGKRVRVEYDWRKKDRHGRALVYLYLEDGTFFNAEIVRQGYAHAYTRHPFEFLEQFRAYEREARENQRGLWGARPRRGNSRTSSGPVLSPTQDPEETVFITKTGTKYHRAGCPRLTGTEVPIALKHAAASFEPCSVCRPAAETGEP